MLFAVPYTAELNLFSLYQNLKFIVPCLYVDYEIIIFVYIVEVILFIKSNFKKIKWDFFVPLI